MYQYNAVVTSVYDGDTITVDIDLGLGVWIKGEKLRLARINAPEVRGEERPEGIASRDWLRAFIAGKSVVITTRKDKKGKFGRYIAEVYHQGTNINDKLVTVGAAEYKTY